MVLNKNFATAFAIGMTLLGCGHDPKQMVDFRDDSYFGNPEPEEVISPRWIRVASFRVEDQSSYDAHVEVAVRGKRSEGGTTYCELVTSHIRFRQDRAWSPLPMAFFSPSYESPDGKEDLNDLFRDTLDFNDKTSDRKGIKTQVSFTRGKTFAANWHIYPLLTTMDGKEACTAAAVLEKSSQVNCHAGSHCRVKEIIARVDKWRHVFQSGNPPRQVDDLSALILSLEDLDGEGYPNGATYLENVPEFR